AGAILKLGKDQLLLGLPDMLHERLFGVLRGNPTEICRGYFNFQFLPNLRIRLDPAGVEQRNLIVFGNDSVTDDELRKGPNVSVFWVNRTTELPGRSDRLLGGGNERLLDSRDQDIFADAFLAFPKL